MVPWNPARTKVQIRLSIQRLRTLQEKRLALAKKSRREIADLLLKGRIETSRLRVEGLIQDDIYVELLELLELYTEKLQARFGLLDASITEPEGSIEDAVCAIVYAAPRTELKELQVLREIIMHKFGRAWSIEMQSTYPPPASVPPRVLSKLALYTPPKELVDLYLGEIAKSYGVPFEASRPMDPLEEGKTDTKGDEDDSSGPGDGQEKVEAKALEPALVTAEVAKKPNDSPAAGRKDGGEASALPDLPSTTLVQDAPPKKVNEDDELAKRFERLKNLR